MTVRVRKYVRRRSSLEPKGWEVDIQVERPDGSVIRQRLKPDVSTEDAALRWAKAREQKLALERPVPVRKEVPTLEEFVPLFLDGHARANRQKPSGIAAKDTALRVHIVPFLGTKKLDAVTDEDVQLLKLRMATRAPKTVNNTLSILSMLLKIAVQWGKIERLPCTIRLLKTMHKEAAFHDFVEYERLVEAAKQIDARAHLIVLLGGDAGLRCGEMMALERSDISSHKNQIRVQRSDWKGHVTTPKGGRARIVPMTSRLAGALQSHRHLRGVRVLCQEDGSPLTQKVVQNLVRKAARRADLQHHGVHILRHTFCSHLAMRGAPARAIQELAGHANISTTQRYMHLSPAAVEGAIRLLEMPPPMQAGGGILEAGTGPNPKAGG